MKIIFDHCPERHPAVFNCSQKYIASEQTTLLNSQIMQTVFVWLTKVKYLSKKNESTEKKALVTMRNENRLLQSNRTTMLSENESPNM